MHFLQRPVEYILEPQYFCSVCAVVIVALLFSLLPQVRNSNDRHPISRESDYKVAKAILRGKMTSTDTYALFLRLAWSDAATYDKSIQDWPKRGGANGSIRFDHELDFVENRGLIIAITLLESVKDECPSISWADLIQMSGALAVELLGGPKIDLKYGRLDAKEEDEFRHQLAKSLPRSNHHTQTDHQLLEYTYVMCFIGWD